MSTDASDIAFGIALMQEQIDKYIQLMYYASKALTKTERKCNTRERTALEIIYAMSKFKHYLLGSTVVFHVSSSLGVHSRKDGSIDVNTARI